MSLVSSRARSLRVFAAVCVLGVTLSGAVRAEPLVSLTQPVLSRSVQGFGPDAQLVGGIGFGIAGKLDNYFLARARLGALYASSPWIVNLGLSAEVGALAGFGWGAEVELSRGGTFFGTLGVARVDDSRWLAHGGLGFTIFGLEWQHVFGGPNPRDAVLLEVRLPLGLWWLHKRQEKAEAQATAFAPPPPQIKPRTAMPRGPTVHEAAPGSAAPAAESGEVSRASAQGQAAATVSDQKRRAPTAADIAARDAEVAARLAEAQAAREKGERFAEAIALARAYALRPDASVALQLSAAELALGKPRGALADWQRVGDIQQLPAAERERATQLQQQLTAALAHLRLELTGSVTTQDTVWIDGAPEPIATQGYDVPLDPGAHTLQVRRGEHVLAERAFEAAAGALVRLSIEVSPAD